MKLRKGRFRLDIKRSFLTVGYIRLQDSLSRQKSEDPSFGTSFDKTLDAVPCYREQSYLGREMDQ